MLLILPHYRTMASPPRHGDAMLSPGADAFMPCFRLFIDMPPYMPPIWRFCIHDDIAIIMMSLFATFFFRHYAPAAVCQPLFRMFALRFRAFRPLIRYADYYAAAMPGAAMLWRYFRRAITLMSIWFSPCQVSLRCRR